MQLSKSSIILSLSLLFVAISYPFPSTLYLLALFLGFSLSPYSLPIKLYFSQFYLWLYIYSHYFFFPTILILSSDSSLFSSFVFCNRMPFFTISSFCNISKISGKQYYFPKQLFSNYFSISTLSPRVGAHQSLCQPTTKAEAPPTAFTAVAGLVCAPRR